MGPIAAFGGGLGPRLLCDDSPIQIGDLGLFSQRPCLATALKRIGDEASRRLLESVTLHQWAGASQDLNALSRRTAQTRANANSSFAFSQLRN